MYTCIIYIYIYMYIYIYIHTYIFIYTLFGVSRYGTGSDVSMSGSVHGVNASRPNGKGILILKESPPI